MYNRRPIDIEDYLEKDDRKKNFFNTLKPELKENRKQFFQHFYKDPTKRGKLVY